jgi:formate hydrogenlyase subunit 3/multisubunit Na+/H+ antiporter MnhD subunit
VLVGIGAIVVGGALAVGRRTLVSGLGVQAAGCALLAVGGLWALAAGESTGSTFTSAFDPRLGVDPLSGLFLGVLGAVGTAALVFPLTTWSRRAAAGRSARSRRCSCSSRRWSSWRATRSPSSSPGRR